MNSQQLGKFFIEEKLVRENPEIVAAAFWDMKFVPVHIEINFMHKELEYTGISPKFKEVKRWMFVPSYRIDIFMNQAEGEEPEYSHMEVTKL